MITRTAPTLLAAPYRPAEGRSGYLCRQTLKVECDAIIKPTAGYSHKTMDDKLTFRRYSDGDHDYKRWSEDIFNEDTSYKCPTYVHKTPPCQGSCPSGEDIRG